MRRPRLAPVGPSKATRAAQQGALACLWLAAALASGPVQAQPANAAVRVDLQCAERVLRLELREPRATLVDGRVRIRLEAAHSASGVRYISDPGHGQAPGAGVAARPPSTFVWLKGDRARVSLAGLPLPECQVVSSQGLPAADPVAWRAGGQEPGWSLHVQPRSMNWIPQPGTALPPSQQVRLAPVAGPSGGRWYALTLRPPGGDADRGLPVEARLAARTALRMEVRDAVCRDAMSGMPHPQQVRLWRPSEAAAPWLSGCGGDPATLLAAHRRVVRELPALEGGLPDVRMGPGATGAPTLEFTPDPPAGPLAVGRSGVVSGQTGCNLFRANWTLTGEGLSFGPVLSTRRACPDAQSRVEHRFLEALQGAQRLDVSDQGLLSLIAADGRLLLTAEPD